MIVNLQRKAKLDIKPVREFADRLAAEVEEAKGRDFSVAFVSDRKMTELNKFFRNKDTTTDVLSFPHEPDNFETLDNNDQNVFLGDIVISAEQAQRQAKENKLSLDNEIKQLLLHGLLHLCGYDHETDTGEMNARELELRDKLSI